MGVAAHQAVPQAGKIQEMGEIEKKLHDTRSLIYSLFLFLSVDELTAV
jgi:hypothetical protein